MSNTRLLSELLKTLPSVSDAGSLAALLTDANGELKKITPTSLTGLRYKSATTGAALCSNTGIHLVIAFSKSDVHKYLVGLYLKRDYSGQTGAGNWIVLKSEGLTNGAWNTIGTITITGADDIIFKVVNFVFDMTT